MAQSRDNSLMALKDLFLLDPEVIFLNHGSFGATPKPVFEAYQHWQRQLELEPVRFIDKELPELFGQARQALANYVNANPEDIVYVPNATFGVNVVARSLALEPGDEVLVSDHEYGACLRAWRFMSQKRGFRIVEQPIPLPLPSPDEFVKTLWRGVTKRTKVIFISHITSPTAQRFPVEAICAKAREAGILTMIDGAHALGQIDLDLQAVGADFYTGNGHKWLCSPKGSAFLYTKPDKQSLIEPLIVGWGWGEDRLLSYGSDYLDFLQWLGTNDPSAYLAVPAAIQFQAEHDWAQVRLRCHDLADQAICRIRSLTGLPYLYESDAAYDQMAIAPLPLQEDLKGLQKRLFDESRIEIPLIDWNDQHFIRVSVQGYNDQEDIHALLRALEQILWQ